MKRIYSRSLSWLLGLAVVAAIAWSFVPQPVTVDVARVSRGPMMVTIDEDGRTRVRDRFTVSAPVGGYLSRIAYRPGTIVKAGQSVATIFPAPPSPIDARTQTQLEARVESSVDALRQARMRVDAARATLSQATRAFDRQSQLEKEHVIAPQELDVARTRQRVAEVDVETAAAGVDVAEHDVEAARAALIAADAPRPIGRPTHIRAPRDGAILRLFEESERTVAAGTPLLELGAPDALEIIVDLLSTDAVQVRPGTPVLVDRWGGEGLLNGRVRLTEPSSFTKTSALGVEEQRVNVVIDFIDPPQRWHLLGDGFAVEVRIVTWNEGNALTVPISALFRRGDRWMVYKVIEGRAVEQHVWIGRQNDVDAAVNGGLGEGDRVIVHPSDRVADRTRVIVRSE
jgi:HlyD family secretion protein